MLPRRIRKTHRQAAQRRQVAFFTLSQGHEPEERFVDPAAAHHDEMVALLPPLSPRQRMKHRDQLELWTVAPIAAPFRSPVRPRARRLATV